jgi:trimeric autotransporter adhesin
VRGAVYGRIMKVFAVAASALALAAPAAAVNGNDPTSSWITDGTVYAVAATPSQVVVGGDFTLIGRQTGSWVGIDADGSVPLLPPAWYSTVDQAVSDGSRGWFLRTEDGDGNTQVVHLLADRSLDPKWKANVDGTVNAIADDGTTLYVGGDFTKVNGARRERLASFDNRTRKLSAWAPQIEGKKPKDDAEVDTLLVAQQRIFFAGSFAKVNGKSRNTFAALSGSKLTPWKPVVNGDVYVLAAGPNRIYVGGDFEAVDGKKRNELAAVNDTDGGILPWNPVANGAIEAIAPTAGVVYVGGTFTSVGGKSRRGMAAISATSADATSWDANVNGEVDAILPEGGSVYFGGVFDRVGGFPRSNLAAANTTSGAATAWDPRSDARVHVLRMGASGRILAGGEFATVGAIRREGLAALSLDGKTVLPWVPSISGTVRALAYDPRTGNVYLGGRYRLDGEPLQRSMAIVAGTTVTPFGGDFNAFVDTIASATDGTVYAGGAFSTVQGKARKRLVALDPTGALASWNAGANGLVTALVLVNDELYVGGNFTSIGGASRRGVAQLDTAGALATGWDAGLDGNVFALTAFNDVLYLAGTFENIGPRARNYLGSVFEETATPTAWDPDPDDTASALCLDPSGSLLYAGGDFTQVGRAERDAAEFDTAAGFLLGWRPSAAFSGRSCTTSLDGSTLYLGGEGAFSVYR